MPGAKNIKFGFDIRILLIWWRLAV